MIVISLCALLCALVTALILHDMHRHRMALLIAMPVLSLGLYLWMGTPDQPGAPALFERTGPRAEQRALAAQELALMQALSEDDENLTLMLALGTVRMRAGRTEEAIRILEHAQTSAPDDKDVRTELAAAYYAHALSQKQGDARLWLEKAYDLAPADAPYRTRLEQDFNTPR